MKPWILGAGGAGSAVILLAAAAAWAQSPVKTGGLQPGTLTAAIVSTLIFGLIGIGMTILGFKLFDAVIPFNLEQEIAERQNIAVAILCGAMVLGISLIVAAAVL